MLTSWRSSGMRSTTPHTLIIDFRATFLDDEAKDFVVEGVRLRTSAAPAPWTARPGGNATTLVRGSRQDSLLERGDADV